MDLPDPGIEPGSPALQADSFIEGSLVSGSDNEESIMRRCYVSLIPQLQNPSRPGTITLEWPPGVTREGYLFREKLSAQLVKGDELPG